MSAKVRSGFFGGSWPMFQACFPWGRVLRGKRWEEGEGFQNIIPPGELSSEQCSKEDLIYDRSVMKTTLIEDYGLVCEKAGLRSEELHYTSSSQSNVKIRTIYNSIYMLGMLFGSYIFGWISDRFGRWLTIISSFRKRLVWIAIVWILISPGWRPWCYQQLQFPWVVSLGKLVLLFQHIYCFAHQSLLHWTAWSSSVCSPSIHHWSWSYWQLYGLLRSRRRACWVQGNQRLYHPIVNLSARTTVAFMCKCNFQFTMLIGIAIEMPFALGEMLLGLEVIDILGTKGILRRSVGLLHPWLEDSSDGFLPSPSRLLISKYYGIQTPLFQAWWDSGGLFLNLFVGWLGLEE